MESIFNAVERGVVKDHVSVSSLCRGNEDVVMKGLKDIARSLLSTYKNSTR